MLTPKAKAAAISVGSNTLLILLKIVAGLITGSISLVAEAVHSLMDLAAAVIAFFSVRVSDKPADKQHPFGHGKVESVSGFVEALLIAAAAGIIVYQAIHRLIVRADLEYLEIGLIIMGISIVINVAVSRNLLRVARITESLALEADARHLTTDVLTMVGVFIGLGLVKLTGLTIFDPIVAILVALLILKAAYDITRKAFDGLMDTSLTKVEEDMVSSAIMEHVYNKQLVGFHEMRTRRSGSFRFVDLHLTMPKHVNIEEAHSMCDHLEQDIKSRLPNSNVIIHVEPCETECSGCKISCHFAEQS
jgi:cation diffusion facilitator family transporter